MLCVSSFQQVFSEVNCGRMSEREGWDEEGGMNEKADGGW